MPYILLRGAFPHGGTYVSMDACEIAAKQALGVSFRRFCVLSNEKNTNITIAD